MIGFIFSILGLKKLESLYLKENQFSTLSSEVQKLENLHSLDLSSNKKLRSLEQGIAKLENLKSIELAGCTELQKPPQSIWKQGIEAIRHYCKEEKRCRDYPTVAVIGASLSGKTSLVETLRDDERVLKWRRVDSISDEATKVFNFVEVKIEDDQEVIRYIDFGGHEIYHITYCFTLREKCIPVVVVSMQQYQEVKNKGSAAEAVKRLFFDWLSHLYVSQPNLGPPRLVLTHKDKFEEIEFKDLRKEFLKTVETVRRTISTEASKAQLEILHRIKHFDNLDVPLFQGDEVVYEVGDEYGESFQKLKYSLFKECEARSKEAPERWQAAGDVIGSLQGCFCKLEYIGEKVRDKISEEELKTFLGFMHDCGKLLWYKDIPELEEYVFHDVASVTQLLKVLFDHTRKGQKYSNIKSFVNEQNKRVEEEECKALMHEYYTTGVGTKTILLYLIREGSNFKDQKEQAVALQLLQSFKLAFGPVQRDSRECYISPSFSPDYWELCEFKNMDLHFDVDLHFLGLPLPKYVYHQMTVGLLELFPKHTAKLEVKHNGAVVSFDDATLQLKHDYKSQSVKIHIGSKATVIRKSWKRLILATNKTIKHTLETWKGANIDCSFYCLHCKLLGKKQPRRIPNPSWCKIDGTDADTEWICRFMDPVSCEDDHSVPAVLTEPCKNKV